MAKRDPIQEALETLGGLRSAGEGELESQLRPFLRHRSNLVMAKAAKIARERRAVTVVPEMVAAFRKLMADPARLDKRCEALIEIAAALYELDYTEPPVYQLGLRHVQLEGSYGPPVDTAAPLRGICAQGLARTRYPDALEEVVDLLTDSEAAARIGAARALAANGGTGGGLALRLKILTGDREPEVLAECFSGLLQNTENAVDFVARYMDSADAGVAEAAILALGASRSSKAVAALQDGWRRAVRSEVRSALLSALSSSRREEALVFLLGELKSGSMAVAKQILAVLAAQRPSPSIRQMIEAAVQQRGDHTLQESWRSMLAAEG